MKADRLYSVGHFVCDEVEIPVPHGNELLVKVGACGICGSDYPRVFEHGSSNRKYPLTIGHEFSGEIVAAGENANENLIGKKGAIFPLIPCMKCGPCSVSQYAMCESYDYLGSRRDGGMAEYCLIPSSWNFIESKSASMQSLAMTEPARVAQHAVRKGNVCAGQTAVVFGAGPIGIMAARWIELFGAKPILVDINENKIQFAKQRGYDIVNSEKEDVAQKIRELNGGCLADVAIEGTGAGSALIKCVECVRPCGNISLLGNPIADVTLPLEIHSMIMRKELTLSRVWNSSRCLYPVSEWKYTVAMMDAGKFVADNLITDKLSLEEIPEFMLQIKNRNKTCVKAMYVSEPNMR